MQRHIYRDLLAAGAVSIVLAAAAMGFGGPECEGMREACRDDVETLCADAESRREVHECLAANQAHLSEECAEKVAAKAERIAAFEAACGEDVAAFCPDDESPRAVRHCLDDHFDDISQECHDELAAAPRRHGRHGPRPF